MCVLCSRIAAVAASKFVDVSTCCVRGVFGGGVVFAASLLYFSRAGTAGCCCSLLLVVVVVVVADTTICPACKIRVLYCQVGMTTSNEPGYYEDGEFGLRIEK